MMQVIELLKDPAFWSGMWEDVKSVLTRGTPPVYVQYLIATVIYLSYLLFIHDPRRAKRMPLSRWLGNPTSLVYFATIIAITLGATNAIIAGTDPNTYVRTLEDMRPSRIPVISDIFEKND